MVKRYDTLESIRKRSSMSQKLSVKDQEYAWYSGGSFELGEKMAVVDVFLKNKLIPEKLVPFIKLYRAYLDQKRKAFFATVGSTEITKLGLLLGLKDDKLRFEDK